MGVIPVLSRAHKVLYKQRRVGELKRKFLPPDIMGWNFFYTSVRYINRIRHLTAKEKGNPLWSVLCPRVISLTADVIMIHCVWLTRRIILFSFSVLKTYLYPITYILLVGRWVGRHQ